MIDKRIESTMNELINAEIWSTNLYLSLQVYFESEQLPILSSWLNTQAQDNMNKVYQMMSWIYQDVYKRQDISCGTNAPLINSLYIAVFIRV